VTTHDPAQPRGGAKCPICRKAAELDYRPFCSKRCADVDLHRWLVGAYAVPATVDDEDEAADDPDAADRG